MDQSAVNGAQSMRRLPVKQPHGKLTQLSSILLLRVQYSNVGSVEKRASEWCTVSLLRAHRVLDHKATQLLLWPSWLHLHLLLHIIRHRNLDGRR